MPRMVEVDEVELIQARKLRETVSTILAHPKAKLLVQQAYKTVNPQAITPELDQQQAVAAPIDEMRKELDAFKAETVKKDAETEKNTKIASLQQNHAVAIAKLRRDGWTDEGIKGVEQIMVEKGILEPEIAAAYFEKLHPPQTPATPSGSGAWNFVDPTVTDGDGDLKKLIESRGENPGLVDKMARDALTEVRGQSRR